MSMRTRSYVKKQHDSNTQRSSLSKKYCWMKATIPDTALGNLDIFPLELKFLVFSYLTVEELSILTITSKELRNVVELYRGSTYAQKFLLPKPISHKVIPPAQQMYYNGQFKKLGILVKRSTCLLATKERIKYIQQFLQTYLCNYHKNCEDPARCIALSCYGKFLHTVIAGWEEAECSRVYNTISDNTKMGDLMLKVMGQKPGYLKQYEMHLRLFFRRVYLDQAPTCVDTCFWLQLILRNFPLFQQARILFILYGPASSTEIMWKEVSETTPDNKFQAEAVFGDLAYAFKLLYEHGEQWGISDVVSLVGEIITLPAEWLTENLAHLLVLTGEEITKEALCSKAINGRFGDLSTILLSLSIACTKHEIFRSWLSGILSAILQHVHGMQQRRLLMSSVVDSFKELLTELYLDEHADDVKTLLILEAWGHLCKALVHLALETGEC